MPKVAVITGSNGLIGQATCRRLAQSGHLAVGIDVGADGATGRTTSATSPTSRAWRRRSRRSNASMD
jgi:NAD(P)-dependent dehydrogenase (short-subunit alcohol dehydrogenase family)